MIEFVRLIEANCYQYNIRVDDINDINTLLADQKSFTVRYLLEVKASGEYYSLDLGKLMLSEPALLPATDIHDMISRLTPSMVYSYQSDINFRRIVRSFNHKDLPDRVEVSPYNSVIHEETSSSYDPSFRDMIIRCAGYDLTKVFPIIDGKLRRATWHNNSIILKDEVYLTRTTENIHFISFAEANVSTKTAVEMAQLDWTIGSGKTPLVVLNGALYTNEDVFVYKFNGSTRRLDINPAFLERHYAEAGYESAADMLNDNTTFIILVDCLLVMTRNIPIVSIGSSRPTPCIYFDQAKTHPVDYLCIHQSNRNILDISIMDNTHINVTNLAERDEHHAYVDINDDGGISLVQMAICC
jgi:hypothetical protein